MRRSVSSWLGQPASLHSSASICTPQTLRCPVNKPRLFSGWRHKAACIDPIVIAGPIKEQSCQTDGHLTSVQEGAQWSSAEEPSTEANQDRWLIRNCCLEPGCALLRYSTKNWLIGANKEFKWESSCCYSSVVMVWIRRVTREVHVLEVCFPGDGTIERRIDHRDWILPVD